MMIFLIIMSWIIWHFKFENISNQNKIRSIDEKEKQVEIIKRYSPKEILSIYKKMSKEDIKNIKDPSGRDLMAKTLSNNYFLNKEIMIGVLPMFIKNATDKKVSILFRVRALNKLGNYFCDAGRNEFVGQAIYKYPEMKHFLKEANGDYSLAGRKIYEKSIELKPTAYGINMLSHWYAKQILIGKNEKKYIERIHRYMEIYKKFEKKGYKSKVGDYWASMSYAALCKIGEKKYCKIYRNKINNIHTTWGILFSSYYYWIVDGDKEKAKQNMEENIDYFEKFNEKSSMAILWNNERKRKVDPDLMHKAITDMSEISPSFRNWLNKIEK